MGKNANEYNSHDAEGSSRTIKPGKLLKALAVIIIISVYFLLFGRMYLSKDRGIMNRFSYSENISEIYGDAVPTLMTQTIDNAIDENGYYRVSNFVYLPDAHELQVNVRYNNSTEKKLRELYPDADSHMEQFVFFLSDSSGNIYSEYNYLLSANLIYNFRKLSFSGLDFDKIDVLYLNVRYMGDTDKEAPMTKSYLLYDRSRQSYESNLTINAKSKTDSFKSAPALSTDSLS